MINLDRQVGAGANTDDADENYGDNDRDDRDSQRQQAKFGGHKTSSFLEDMLQIINNSRLNVNNYIIGSSNNFMGRVRKLSMSELSHRNVWHRYKIACSVTDVIMMGLTEESAISLLQPHVLACFD